MLKFGGVVWLLWLACQMWRDSEQGITASSPLRGNLASVGAGTALCLGNPATFVFYMVLLPSIAPRGLAEAGSIAPILLVSLVTIGASLATIILLATHLRRVLISPSANAVFG